METEQETDRENFQLLNGADVKTAALSCAQFFSQFLPACHHVYFAQTQKVFTLGEEFSALLLQIHTVPNHQDGR